MTANATVFVKCRFTRGGFAHERIFWIAAPDGKGEYRGLAYIGHCFKRDRSPLVPGEPPPGQSIDGLLEARYIERMASGLVTIEVPDSEVCDVAPSLIEEPRDVLVGS